METYAPFYLEYYILMALHLQFAQTALGVQRRYYRLNLAIRNTFSLSKSVTFLNSTIKINIQPFLIEYAYIEKFTEKALNVKKDKVIKDPVEQRSEIASHEITLPGSNVNSSNMSAKSVVKIATLSRAIAPEENHTVSPSFDTGKHSASLPTISFGVVLLNNLMTGLFFSFCVRIFFY